MPDLRWRNVGVSRPFWSHWAGATCLSSRCVPWSILMPTVLILLFVCFIQVSSSKWKRFWRAYVLTAESWKPTSWVASINFLYSFRTPPSKFSGGSLHVYGEPQTRTTFCSLDNRGRSSTRGRGVKWRAFSVAWPPRRPYCTHSVMVGHEVAWWNGGLNEECRNNKRNYVLSLP